MSRIQLTILGTTAGVPTRERSHPAIHIRYDDGEEFCCLLDCGEGTQRQLMVAALNMMKIDNIFITHWHGDHCLGLPGMMDTMGLEGRRRPLTIYAPEARRARQCLKFSRSMTEFKIAVRNVPARGNRVTCLLETGRFRMVSVPVRHRVPAVAYALLENDKTCIDLERAVNLGLPGSGEIYRQLKTKGEIFLEGRRIRLEDVSVTRKGKKIVYSGDTEICDNLKTLVADADLLIQDCTHFVGQKPVGFYGHAALPEIIELVLSKGVKRAILTHISRRYGDAGHLRSLIESHPGLEIAEDFMTIVV